MEDRPLLQTAAHLVDAGHTDVGARVHGPGRQIGMEGQVRAPRLVHDQRGRTAVADLGDVPEGRATAVGRRAGDQGALRVGMGLEGPLASAADGGCARWRSASHRGSIQTGSIPDRISPDTTDLWASRPISSFSCGPATAGIAAFTERELPHVVKNVCSACTASAISSSARSSTRPRVSRSSRPPDASTSPRKTASPSVSRTAGSAPRACLCPGGVKDRRPRRWWSARASRTGAWVWSTVVAPGCPARTSVNQPRRTTDGQRLPGLSTSSSTLITAS